MKVSELIGMLEELPPDMLVFADDDGEGRPASPLVDTVRSINGSLYSSSDGGVFYSEEDGVEEGMKTLVL
jgi:hypothetical protein